MQIGWIRQSEFATQTSIYSLHSRSAPGREYVVSEHSSHASMGRIRFHADEMDGLLASVYAAMKCTPDPERPNYIPIAAIAGRHGTILVGWQPQDGDERVALTITQAGTRSLSVSSSDLSRWWHWLGREVP